jgi:hypothetical protein
VPASWGVSTARCAELPAHGGDQAREIAVRAEAEAGVDVPGILPIGEIDLGRRRLAGEPGSEIRHDADDLMAPPLDHQARPNRFRQIGST